MKIHCEGVVMFASIIATVGCSQSRSPIVPTVASAPLAAPTVTHQVARGCESAHDTIYVPGISIDAFPSLPPKAQPDHIVLNLNDGTTIWAEPSYGSEDCVNYLDCRRANVILNPIWNDECKPQGDAFEVATADGRLVFNSSLFVVTETATGSTAYVGFTCGRGLAASSFLAVVNRITDESCLPPLGDSNASRAGATMAASMELGAAYFHYRAAYDQSVQCVVEEADGAATASITCY